ncbi:MAG: hypothetical protein KY410_02060 [Proteobacteria bacterium]|nr:hypothetical protein [Pseudomonadota bacterium]
MTDKGSKILLIIGIVLVVLGVLALVFGGIPQEQNAIEIGEASIGVTETETIPTWLAGAGIGIGAILAALGFFGKK